MKRKPNGNPAGAPAFCASHPRVVCSRHTEIKEGIAHDRSRSRAAPQRKPRASREGCIVRREARSRARLERAAPESPVRTEIREDPRSPDGRPRDLPLRRSRAGSEGGRAGTGRLRHHREGAHAQAEAETRRAPRRHPPPEENHPSPRGGTLLQPPPGNAACETRRKVRADGSPLHPAEDRSHRHLPRSLAVPRMQGGRPLRNQARNGFPVPPPAFHRDARTCRARPQPEICVRRPVLPAGERVEGTRPPAQPDEHGELGHRARQGLFPPARRADEGASHCLRRASRRRDDRAGPQGERKENQEEEPSLLDVALRREPARP